VFVGSAKTPAEFGPDRDSGKWGEMGGMTGKGEEEWRNRDGEAGKAGKKE
jgi:hypothetical protein